MARVFCVVGLWMTWPWLSGAQITIIDTGSTNAPGMNVKLTKTGPRAMVEKKDGSQQKITFEREMCSRLMADLKAAGPLNELPTPRCMKSVSFGTSLFIEYKGVRSPDLSCPQVDPRSVALKKDVTEMMAQAKAKAGVRPQFR